MENLSREYLETLSSAELIRLADEYGVDIPDDLDRQFIIGDLLEFADELASDERYRESVVLSDTGQVMNVNVLPDSYNENRVNVTLRNPASIFVWWDLSEYSLKQLNDASGNLRLSVNFFESRDDLKPCDSFEIKISDKERSRYVIIPSDKRFVRVDLMCEIGGREEMLAFSQKISLPVFSDFMTLHPGEKLKIPRAMELSGALDLLHEHYNEYRNSFA